MAGPAAESQNLEIPRHTADPRGLPAVSEPLEEARPERDRIQEACAKLYGQGYPRGKVARILVDHLVPNGKHRPLEQRLSQARAKLRRWERTQSFRDLVYSLAVVELDMSTPIILKGVASKAKRGRVDAARLALEITGRHNPKGEQAPTQVAVVFQGIPRPSPDPRAMPRQLDLEVSTVDEELDE